MFIDTSEDRNTVAIMAAIIYGMEHIDTQDQAARRAVDLYSEVINAIEVANNIVRKALSNA